MIAGKSGSGKATLTRSLIEEVPVDQQIATVEDVHELFLLNHREMCPLFSTGRAPVASPRWLALPPACT
ncbi:Flp pilus assembly complex ATPase component TadA [Burkholderia sp. R-69980]|nr:Flp pilus assembly complex ATPase component TadA [Burkholderia sp. R-69980]